MQKNILQIQVNRAVSARTDSVSNLLAEYITLCQVLDSTSTSSKGQVISQEGFKYLTHSAQALYLLLYETGCRFSEAKSIKHNQITSQGNVLIKGSKGSADRLINTRYCFRYLLECKYKCIDPFREVTYDAFYKALKKFGTGFKPTGNSNNAVVHSLRHEKVDENREVTTDSVTLSKQSGHKNKDNLKFYGKKR
jgi:integrase